MLKMVLAGAMVAGAMVAGASLVVARDGRSSYGDYGQHPYPPAYDRIGCDFPVQAVSSKAYEIASIVSAVGVVALVLMAIVAVMASLFEIQVGDINVNDGKRALLQLPLFDKVVSGIEEDANPVWNGVATAPSGVRPVEAREPPRGR
ncbi:uncharacterized protein LOC119095485 [Pollicipes pollicipes]|uniref:uncharacterized protein LOC119095485 n=1 Tax=Pollicipes pollicipes TaxID=41117 RepID=UPI001884A063|nr:uncharacterized protein LOC119095485 [Pollicipes pollicipes]